MEYVFGQVPARGLGQFPGIDTILMITGNWNCAAGQRGRTWLLI